jgi:uncharacterized protein YneF (UPF0154 family)
MITVLILAVVFIVGVLLGRWAMKKFVESRSSK